MSGTPETSGLQGATSSVQDSLSSAQSTLQDTGAQVAARVDERPEMAVGAAFGGGLLLALILKRLAR